MKDIISANRNDAEGSFSENRSTLLGSRRDSKLYAALFCIISLRMIWQFLYGFRWPSEYVQSCTVFNYSNGFLIRGFVGSCLRVIFGDLAYDKLFLSLFILAVGLLILALFIYVTFDFAVRKHDLLGSVLMLWYSLSIYAAYLAHEMGYFEQYGYVAVLAVILFLSETRNRKALISLTAPLMFILLLISETNAFLICPVLLSICFIRIVTETKKERRSPKGELLFLVLANIPNAVYCVLAGYCSATVDQIAAQIDKIRAHSEYFLRLEEIGNALVSGARANTDYTKGIPFLTDDWQLIAYMLLIVFMVGLALLLLGRPKEALLFGGASCFSILSAWFMNILGWDHERWKFTQAMTVTFLAIWQLRRIDANAVVRKKDMVYTLMIGTFIMLAITDFRLGLFDKAVYNDSIRQMVTTLADFKALRMH